MNYKKGNHMIKFLVDSSSDYSLAEIKEKGLELVPISITLDDKTYLDKTDALSFRGGMDRIFYDVVDEELNVLPENRIFPDPKHPEKVMEIIEKYK